jgi:hypothetical protein
MKGNIWLLSVLVIVLLVGSLGVAGLVSSVSSPEQVTGENITLDGNGTQLAEASGAVQLYQNETVTVENGTNRTTLTRGTDYVIDYDLGVLESNRTQYNGSDVLVNYTVSQPDNARTQRIASLLSLLNPIWPVLVLLAILGTTWSLVSGWW